MSTSNALFSSHTSSQTGDTQVVACLDRSRHAASIVSHAFAIARALNVPVTLLQVLETQPGQDARPDPIEWDLRRHEARRSLGRLVSSPEPSDTMAKIRLAEGATAEEICRFTRGQPGSLLVLGTHGENAPGHRGIGSTAHNVLDRALGSILLIPAGTIEAAAPDYRRILVPVDGSNWAESVIPLAARLAKSAQAELILAHVVPAPELTETRPFEPRDLELQRYVIERNELTARIYLDHVRSYIAAMGVAVRAVLIRADDVRTALAKLIRTEAADLVVLSARGHGGRHHADIPYGSVTTYLMTHSSVPLLIARPAVMAPEPLALANILDARLPVAGPV